MPKTLTSKGQVTIPKKVREALQIGPGSAVEFTVNEAGEVVLTKAGNTGKAAKDRFQVARGRAQIKWKTRELMDLLRG